MPRNIEELQKSDVYQETMALMGALLVAEAISSAVSHDYVGAAVKLGCGAGLSRYVDWGSLRPSRHQNNQ